MKKNERRDKLLLYYKHHQRDLPWRHAPSPYKVWVSEIMLQQTRVATVIPYFIRFTEALPTVEALAGVEDDTLKKLWEGLGYYRRAGLLKAGARYIRDQLGGRLPADRETLLRIPGIGDYTAGAISSIAFGRKESAVDGNVFRVYSRLFAVREPAGTSGGKNRIRALVEKDLPDQGAGDFNQALMDFANEICLASQPLCSQCPLQDGCLARKAGAVSSYPVKKSKRKTPSRAYTVFVIEREGQFLIEQRKAGGLLAGLYQFPMQEGHMTDEQALLFLPSLLGGKKNRVIRPLTPHRHVFSHVIWDLTAYYVEEKGVETGRTYMRDQTDVSRYDYETGRGASGQSSISEQGGSGQGYDRGQDASELGYRERLWVTREELRDRYPMGSAMRPYKDFLEVALSKDPGDG